MPESDLITAFSNQLIIHFGEDDTTPSTSSGGPRNNTTVNNQQGLTDWKEDVIFLTQVKLRLQIWYAIFNWEQHEVPNVGHDPQLYGQ